MSEKPNQRADAAVPPPDRPGHTVAGLGPEELRKRKTTADYDPSGASSSAETPEDESQVVGPAPIVRLPTIGHFGAYEIVGRLAMGGMAEILLARETLEGAGSRYVVVKRILPEHSEDEEFVEMFLDEARIAIRITHPNVCHIYKFGKEQSSYYIAMEWVNGAPLGKVIRRARDMGGVPELIAVKIIAEVAGALASAHDMVGEDGRAMRLIHRDVTPHNIMVTYEGNVKLIDFGIAKASSASHKTSAGVVKGKFAYMPPEQIEGKPIDHRVDIFALAVCLYETLTGRALYRRRDDIGTLRAIVHEPVPKLADRMESPARELEDAIARGLAKDPDERFGDAVAMQQALESYIASRRQVVNARHISDLMRQLFAEELRLGPTVDTAPFGSSYHIGMEAWGPQPPSGADPTAPPGLARDSSPDHVYGELELPSPGSADRHAAGTPHAPEIDDDAPTLLAQVGNRPPVGTAPRPIGDERVLAAQPTGRQAGPPRPPPPRPPPPRPPPPRPQASRPPPPRPQASAPAPPPARARDLLLGATVEPGPQVDLRTDHLQLDEAVRRAAPGRAAPRPGAAAARAARPARRSSGGPLKWILLVGALGALAAAGVVFGPALLSGGAEGDGMQTGPAEAVAPQVGVLRLIVTPDGARVTVGDEDLGTSPVQPKVLQPGTHHLRVALEGYEPFETSLAIEAGDDRTVDVVLSLPEEAQIGHGGDLTLESDPVCRVWIAGRWLGRTPLSHARVPAGVQDVVLEAADGVRFRRRVFVRSEGETSAFLDLREEAARRAPPAR